MMTRRSLFRSAAAAGGMALLPRGAFAAGAGSSGFWYPEETDPHERTFMQWPVSRTV